MLQGYRSDLTPYEIGQELDGKGSVDKLTPVHARQLLHKALFC